MDIDNRIKATYQRYKNGSSESEMNTAEKILRKISIKLGITFEELIDMCGGFEYEIIYEVMGKKFAVFMNNAYSKFLKENYGMSRKEEPFVSKYEIYELNSKNYGFIICVKKGDKEKAEKFFQFYKKKILSDYKTFLKNRPSFDEFLSAFVAKNDLYGVLEQQRSSGSDEFDRKKYDEEMRRQKRLFSIMHDLDDSDFIPDRIMIG